MSLCLINYPMKLAALCLLLFTLCTAETFAASLDTNFGDNGKVAVDLGSYGDQANAVLVQPDGKILVGGSTSNTVDLDFMVFRLRADGSFDTAFNIDGTVSTAVGSNDDEVFALALQEDGKILAAGYSSKNGNRDFAVARYNIDGSLDREFGLEGLMVTAVSDSDDEITGVAVQPDGKILLTGTALGDAGRVVVLSRYEANGTPDYTFADEGFTLSAVGTDARAESLLLTEDGRILVAGTYSTYSEENKNEQQTTALMVLGYDENGDLDTSFGYEGVTVPLDGSVPGAGYGMALRDDGSILVAGSVGADGARDGALFLFGEEGLPDRTFGDMGVLVTDDEEDTVFYDVLVTEEVIATTGVTVGEGGMREALLVTYTKGDGANSAQLFQQQVAEASEEAEAATEAADDDAEETVAQIVTTEVDNEEDYAFSLAAADSGSVVMVGASGSEEVASAAVRKYTIFQSSVSGSSWSSTTGNAYVLTGEAQDVTRTTALIPGEILSGLGTVTERGVVFSMDPLPVLDDSDDDTSTDDEDTDEDTDDETDDDTDDDSTSSTSDETGPSVTSSTESSFSTTEEVILVVSTDENATCRYNKDYDEDYGEMSSVLSSSFGTGHHVDLGTMAEGTYTYYVRCKDEEANTTTPGKEIIFQVADDVPVRSGFSPSDTISDTSPTLSLTTDVSATCKYTESGSGVAYDDMEETFDTTGGTSHSESVSGLADGEYTYYVRCENTSTGAANTTSSEISFTVDTTSVPPSPFSASLTSDDLFTVSHINDTIRKDITSTLQAVGNLFVSTAIAQDDTDTTDTTTDTTDADTEDSDFLEEGSVDEGSGTGKFTARLKDLKPGTFFYARAYAVIDGTTYYGNQVGFQTADSCFVATAAYGSLFHPAVQLLRDFRDRFMLDNSVSRSLVRMYYRYSPPIADIISSNTILRPVTRTLLMPIVGSAWLIMHFGWLWLILPAAAMALLSWFGMQRMQVVRQEEL